MKTIFKPANPILFLIFKLTSFKSKSLNLTIFLLLFSKLLNCQTPAISVSSASMCTNSYGFGFVSTPIPSAVNYSWACVSGTCNANMFPSPFSGESIIIQFPCCGIFTVYCNGYSNSGAFITQLTNTISVQCISATTQPSITNSISNSVTCSGNSLSLIGSGGSNYFWSNGSIGNTIAVTPTIGPNTFFVGTNSSNGCASYNSHYISGSAPSLSITNLNTNDSVCVGSSINLSASGALSYTWMSNPAYTQTSLNIVPSMSLSGINNFSVTGINSSGCLGSTFYTIYINPLCSVVWPGDANRDGIVNSNDVFELGLNALSTGPARSTTNNAWIGIRGANWSGSISSGWNKCHADCNGDGVINANDTLAIHNNFSLTHSFKPSNINSFGLEVKIAPQQVVAIEGEWNKADVLVGDNSNNLNQVYGISFDVNFNKSVMQTDSFKLIYVNSFLGNTSQNIHFRKLNFSAEKLVAASVRTNQNNVSGNGKIAEVWYKLQNNLPSNSSVTISTSNVNVINSSAVINSLPSSAAITQNIISSVGLDKNIQVLQNITISPNPSHDVVNFVSYNNLSTMFKLLDISGRLILSGEFTSYTTLDVSEINKGVYFVEFKTAQGKTQKKLVKD